MVKITRKGRYVVREFRGGPEISQHNVEREAIEAALNSGGTWIDYPEGMEVAILNIGGVLTSESRVVEVSVDYFVRPGGSDGNDGLTRATAWATPEFALANADGNSIIQFAPDTPGGTASWTGNEFPFVKDGQSVVFESDGTYEFGGNSTADRLDAMDFQDRTLCSIDGSGATVIWFGGASAAFDNTVFGDDSKLNLIAKMHGADRCILTNVEIYNSRGRGSGASVGIQTSATTVDCAFLNSTWNGHGISERLDPGPTKNDRGDGVALPTGCLRFRIMNIVWGHHGHNCIEDFGTNTVIRGMGGNNIWSDIPGEIADAGQRFAELDHGQDCLYEKNFLSGFGGISDNAFTPMLKLVGKHKIFRFNLLQNNPTGHAVASALRLGGLDINCENISSYGNSFDDIASSSHNLTIEDADETNDWINYRILGNVTARLRQNPRSGAGSSHDTEIRMNYFDPAPTIRVDQATEVSENTFDNTEEPDVNMKGISGPDRKTLTAAEADQPATFFDNEQKTVSYPDNTGTTFADYVTADEFPGIGIINAGSSGNVLTLNAGQAWAFWDGGGHSTETGDQITIIRAGVAQGTRTITSRDGAADQLTLDSAITVEAGDEVHLTVMLNGGSTASIRGVIA